MEERFGVKKRYFKPSFPEEDKMGFAKPSTPSHTLQLLNKYSRTDLLRSIHEKMQYQIDNPGKKHKSPLDNLMTVLKDVVDTWEPLNLFETVDRNPFHYDPGYEFDAEKDYAHDMKLFKHHLKELKKIKKEINDF